MRLDRKNESARAFGPAADRPGPTRLKQPESEQRPVDVQREWAKFNAQTAIALPEARTARRGRLEGHLLAPGVRVAPRFGRSLEPDLRPMSKAERRRRRHQARADRPVPAIAEVEPSRGDRTDLIPERGAVVPARSFAGLEGAALVRAIRDESQMTRQLGYRPAREAMFRVIDNVEGVVEGVYTGRKVRTNGIPSADGEDGMNTEHSWPQSKGVRGTPAKYDLHHLFPANAYANGRRGNHPFGMVSGHVRWQESGSKLGFDADGRLVFEPRPGIRGDVARALFYVSAVYGLELPEPEETVLRQWHAEEPPDTAERIRNDEISRYQGNRNPFVDQPELVDRIARFAG